MVWRTRITRQSGDRFSVLTAGASPILTPVPASKAKELSSADRCWRLLSTIRLLPSLRLKEVVARAVVCLQASLAHNFDLDPVIAERVASGATVAEGVLCV
jgi:hypothetical protein